MIYSEEPIVTVGILSNKTITFSLTNDFMLNGSKKEVTLAPEDVEKVLSQLKK